MEAGMVRFLLPWSCIVWWK